MVNLITKSMDIWTSALTLKANGGRGRGNGSVNKSPHGIKKLRELILKLAFTGKLCENSKEQPNYTDIFKSISKERKAFHDERNVRLQKFEPLQLYFDESGIPDNWCFVYLNDVIVFITDFQANGSFATLKKNVQYFQTESYAVLVRLKDLRHNLTREEDFVYTDKHGYDFLSKSFVKGGEIVVANVGAGVGTTLEIPSINRPATLAPNMFMVVLSKHIDKGYFEYFSQSPIYWEHINRVNVGTGQPKINKKEYKSCRIPFPPIEEQHRIVAKVDVLMALCDQLEQQQTDSNEAHQILVETLLGTLPNVADQKEFARTWQRIANQFDTLFTTEQSIDQLKQTILQLAVMGKLVPQDPNDEPANVLLENIAKEKTRLIKEGKIKKQKPLPEIGEGEKPFELPGGWKWERLGNIGETNIGLTYSPKDVSDTGTPVLRANSIFNGKLVFSDLVRVNIEPPERVLVNEGDLLICARSGSRALVGKTAIISKLPEKMAFGAFMAIFRSSLNRYVYHFINSHLFRQVIDDVNTTTINQITQGNLRATLMPTPPLAEQHRIVAKVDELMALCDTFKSRLNDAQITQVQLADTIVEQAVA